MNIFAYCCASFERATRRAAGVEPVLSPPVDCCSLDLHLLEDRELLYFDLHGEPGAPWWRGDGGLIALTDAQIRSVDLGGAIIFAVNCYLADEASPMLEALLDAGARFVVGGQGRNWAGKRTLMGAGLLGLRFRRMLERDWEPMVALAVAKRWLKLLAAADRVMGKGEKAAAAQDALAFRAFYRRRI